MTRVRTARGVALLALLAVFAAAPALATAATPRASLTDIENDVICPSCHEPLALAQSPQAQSERDFIRGLIAQGLTKAQIERQLVAQYGQAVLGRPPADGFNLTVYILPPAILLAGAALLAVTLPKWRQRSRQAAPLPAGPRLDATDSRRLDEDLSRFA
jgi:cytochrome c-type biogenesis protein CcmH